MEEQTFQGFKIPYVSLGVLQRENQNLIAFEILTGKVDNGKSSFFITIERVGSSLRKQDGILWVGDIFLPGHGIGDPAAYAKRKCIAIAVGYVVNTPLIGIDYQWFLNIGYEYILKKIHFYHQINYTVFVK